MHALGWVGFYRISLNNASHQFNSTVKLPMEVKLMPRSHFFLQDGKLKQNGTFRAFFFSAPKVVVFFCHRPRGSFHQVGGLAIETVAEQERLLGQRMNGQHRLLLRSIGRRERKRRAGASLSRLPMGHWLSLLLLGAEQRREKRKGGARATMPAKPKRVVLGLAFSLQCTLACRFRGPRTCTPRSCFLSADSQNTLQSWCVFLLLFCSV